MTEVSIQLGLYGGCTEITDVHVVAAHTRTLSDGSTTFVGEHLRWNRGRQGPRLKLPRVPDPETSHPSLFAAPSAEAPTPATSPAPAVLEAPEDGFEAVLAEAEGQLTLW